MRESKDPGRRENEMFGDNFGYVNKWKVFWLLAQVKQRLSAEVYTQSGEFWTPNPPPHGPLTAF